MLGGRSAEPESIDPMQPEPTISIITPAFNAEATIWETVSSLRAQTLAPFEYVVVDAMSDDSTPDIIEASRDVVSKYIRERDDGIYHGMNKGLRAVTGEIVGIINADDALERTALARVARTFASHPETDFVFSDLKVIDAAGNFLRLQRADTRWVQGGTSFFGRDWRMNMVIPHPTLFVRRRVYAELGLFDTRYRLCADHEFVARLIRSRRKGRHIAGEPLASFRQGGQSTRKMIECFKEDELIARKYGVPSVFARLIRLNKSRWFRRHQAALLST